MYLLHNITQMLHVSKYLCGSPARFVRSRENPGGGGGGVPRFFFRGVAIGE